MKAVRINRLSIPERHASYLNHCKLENSCLIQTVLVHDAHALFPCKLGDLHVTSNMAAVGQEGGPEETRATQPMCD